MKITYYEKLKDGKRFREIPAKLAFSRLNSHYHKIEEPSRPGEFVLETTFAYYKVVAEKE